MYTIGVDVGTSGTKAVLLDTQNNRVVADAHYTYQLENWDDRSELNPLVYWEAVKDVVKSLLRQSGIEFSNLSAISCSSQAETLICVDETGNPLRNAIVWLDNRSVQEAILIEKHFTTSLIYRCTGQPEVVPTWPATKILWLKNNEPNVFQRVHKFLMVEDYILYKLSGQFVTDFSVSSSTLYLDIHTQKWWEDMLRFIGISETQLPKLAHSGTVIGTLKNAEINVGSCAVVVGSYDHAAGAIGAGNIKPGRVSETTGSSMAMVVTTTSPVISPNLSVPCQIHALPGLYFLLPYGQTAGMALKWFMQTFCQEELEKAQKLGTDVYDLLTAQAETIVAGSDGLIMLPHLAGAGSPEFDTNCKGAYVGFTLHMHKAHFIRSLMESVAAMVCKNLEALKTERVVVDQIVALGGGAKSALWNQIKADMSGIPIDTLQVQEAPSLGAAIIAAVGVGLYPDFNTACSKTVLVKETYVPNDDAKHTYQHVFTNYKKLYTSLQSYW